MWYAKWSLRRELKPERTRAERLNQFFENAALAFLFVVAESLARWQPDSLARVAPQPAVTDRLAALGHLLDRSTMSASYGIYQLLKDGLRGLTGLDVANERLHGRVRHALSECHPQRRSRRSAVRGSLDLLMSTPLSTRTIVLGKWWAVFRVVPVLAVIPALGP